MSNLLNLCCQIEVSGVRCKAGKNENLAFEYCRQDWKNGLILLLLLNHL